MKVIIDMWTVEYTNEFEAWWNTLDEDQQVSVAAVVELLEELGPHLGYPHSSSILGSRHSHLRELRVQHQGRPLRVLYAFDPRRSALLLIGADKTGKDRWYKLFVPRAEKLYDQHLDQLGKEGLLND